MDTYYGWGLPINISTHGDKIDLLIRLFHVLMAVVLFSIAYTAFTWSRHAKTLNSASQK